MFEQSFLLKWCQTFEYLHKHASKCPNSSSEELWKDAKKWDLCVCRDYAKDDSIKKGKIGVCRLNFPSFIYSTGWRISPSDYKVLRPKSALPSTLHWFFIQDLIVRLKSSTSLFSMSITHVTTQSSAKCAHLIGRKPRRIKREIPLISD